MTTIKIDDRTGYEMAEVYHAWKLLKKQVEGMEADLKGWAKDNGDIPISDSKAWGPTTSNGVSILADAEDFTSSFTHLVGTLGAKIAISKSVTMAKLEVACAMVAAVDGRKKKDVIAETLAALTSMNLAVPTETIRYAERAVVLSN